MRRFARHAADCEPLEREMDEKMRTDRVLQDFEGAWRLTKRIENSVGPSGRFEGEAIWEPGADGLCYVERGRLWMGDNASFQAERRYLWRAGLEVFFDDGRFFHTVPARGGQALHDCPPDTYQVTYQFDTWPRFETIWHVTGPRKSYVMASTYER